MVEFVGAYRAVVAENNDPQGNRRLRVRIPQITGSDMTKWIWPVETASMTLEVPPIGSGVWVLFENGNLSLPVWAGRFGVNKEDNRFIFVKPLDKSINIEDVKDLLIINELDNETEEVDLTDTLIKIVKNRYFGSFLHTGSQTAAAANTEYIMPLNTTVVANGVSIVNGNTIRIANTGIYNLAFSAQFVATNSSEHTVDIWLKHQGVSVLNSGSKIVFKGATIAAWNFFLESDTPNQEWQLAWDCHSAGVVSLQTEGASGPHPGIPALIVTVNKVR